MFGLTRRPPLHARPIAVQMASLTIAPVFASSSQKMTKSDDIILAPENIYKCRIPDALVRPDELTIRGEQYTRCAVLARGPKSTKRRTSVVWMYGEDLRSKRDERRVWYCYLCEKQRRQQDLPVTSSGNSTALDQLHTKHDIDKSTGEHQRFRRDSVDSKQHSISDFQNVKSIIFSRRLDRLKDVLVRWLVCCHFFLSS